MLKTILVYATCWLVWKFWWFCGFKTVQINCRFLVASSSYTAIPVLVLILFSNGDKSDLVFEGEDFKIKPIKIVCFCEFGAAPFTMRKHVFFLLNWTLIQLDPQIKFGTLKIKGYGIALNEWEKKNTLYKTRWETCVVRMVHVYMFLMTFVCHLMTNNSIFCMNRSSMSCTVKWALPFSFVRSVLRMTKTSRLNHAVTSCVLPVLLPGRYRNKSYHRSPFQSY